MAKKSTGTKAKSAKKLKKANLQRLYSEMNKLSTDAVDREVLKRFKVIIDTSEEDITKKSLSAILKDPKNTDTSIFHDNLQPYIKHFIFLLKKNLKNKQSQKKKRR